MDSLDKVVENLDQNRDDIEHMLLILGAKHATFKDFKEDYFPVYSKCMIDTWESVIGEEFITEVRASWELLIAYITRFMREGFILYHNDDHAETSIGIIMEEPTES